MDSIDWRTLLNGETLGHPGYLTVDLGALTRNYRKLAALAAPAQVSAVVKADAYGLGATRVAEALSDAGCRHFFVAQAGEAIALRPHLPEEAHIYVLNGLLPGAEAAVAAAHITPVINSMPQLARWRAQAKIEGRRLPCLLQFDTGMSRLGFAPSERQAVHQALTESPGIEPLYIMSHLASADEPGAAQNAAQLTEMRKVVAEFPDLPLCFANSGGILMGADFHGTLARPGIALYGGAAHAGAPNPMEPVASLSIAVVQTRTVPAGTLIGYSGTHVAEREMRLATLAAGYADGLPRSLSSRGAVYFNGVRLPITGRVSMDSMTVDMSGLPEGTLDLGSLVEVIGPHQTLEMIAADAGTIAYEILTSLGHRYRRDYR